MRLRYWCEWTCPAPSTAVWRLSYIQDWHDVVKVCPMDELQTAFKSSLVDWFPAKLFLLCCLEKENRHVQSNLLLCFALTWSVPLVPLLWSSGNERILLDKSPEHRAKGWDIVFWTAVHFSTQEHGCQSIVNKAVESVRGALLWMETTSGTELSVLHEQEMYCYQYVYTLYVLYLVMGSWPIPRLSISTLSESTSGQESTTSIDSVFFF